MTTIAYRNGVLAADTALFHNSLYCGMVDKINKVGDFVYGFAGSLTAANQVWNWLLSGGDEGSKPNFTESVEVLRIDLDGYVCLALSDLTFRPWYGEFFAIGSGSEAAYGAMEAGANAEKAVKVACKLDAYTREPIKILKVKVKK